MRGVLRYRREDVVAILDSTRAGETEDGVPIVGSLGEALQLEPTTALVGVVTQGGYFPPAWMELLHACVEHGLDVENGLHVFLADDPALRALAAERGVELRDLRRPPAGLSTATGENLAVEATIVLTVGSDCAIGKMTVSCELDLEARRRGVRSVFVPTGQTGMVIAGWGIAVDAVVADFLAGAAERLVVEGAARGGELLWVEGQGSLLHPVYSGVALGLYHGSVPHLLVLCHECGRMEIEGAGAARTRFRRCASSSSCTSGSRCRSDPRASLRSPSTRARSARRRRARRSRRRRRRPACRPTTPSASGPAKLVDAVLAARTRQPNTCSFTMRTDVREASHSGLRSGARGRARGPRLERRGAERTYIVKPGDTLWSVAERTSSGDPRQGVWELQQRNHLASATIVPGQKLVVP